MQVRDLLDDSISLVSPGAITHVSRHEAEQYLRSELLPPAAPGCPVTPLTAAPGLLVQRVACWDPSSGYAGDGGGDPCASRQVIGELVRAVHAAAPPGGKKKAKGSKEELEEPGSRWLVRWPDGSEVEHSVGCRGVFELAHLHMHRLAGAPLTVAQATRELPVVRSPVWPFATTDDGVCGAIGLVKEAQPGVGVRVLWSRARGKVADMAKEYKATSAEGALPLCHGLLANQPVTCFVAKPGVLVEPAGTSVAAQVGTSCSLLDAGLASRRGCTSIDELSFSPPVPPPRRSCRRPPAAARACSSRRSGSATTARAWCGRCGGR